MATKLNVLLESVYQRMLAEEQALIELLGAADKERSTRLLSLTNSHAALTRVVQMLTLEAYERAEDMLIDLKIAEDKHS